MTNIILLRSSQETPDPYETSFRALGYNASCLPVLETTFTNSDELRRTITNGPAQFAGVVITSARACDAWRHVVEDLAQRPSHASPVTWSSTPFYVVGEATAKALASISETHGLDPLAPKDIRGGSHTGTSERLAHFILGDLPEKEGKKLWYLTGNKNRDILPNILAEGSVNLQSLQVYGTRGSTTLGRDLERVIGAMSTDLDRWWIVFFAPSAAEFATPILQQYFSLPVLGAQGPVTTRSVELAAIGPTTYAFLGDNLRLRVAVCSPKPKADALAAAIKSYDSELAVT